MAFLVRTLLHIATAQIAAHHTSILLLIASRLMLRIASISVFGLLGFALAHAGEAPVVSTNHYSLHGELSFSFFRGAVETHTERLRCEVLRDGELLRIAIC